MDVDLLQTTLADSGQPDYRARQVWEWTARGAAGYDAMTNLPATLCASVSTESVVNGTASASSARSGAGRFVIAS